MISEANPTKDKAPAKTASSRDLVNGLLFLLLVAAIFRFPDYPQIGLDPSWRMVLGRVFSDGLQFGRDVVYNYGPPGFLMGNTYFGLQFWSLILWQFFAAVVFAGVIVWNGRRLGVVAGIFYFLFFLLFGVIYSDALYMIAIAMLGIELVRRPWKGWLNGSVFIALFFAAISMMKFTNLVFATFAILTVCAHHAWLGRKGEALRLAAWFFGGWLAVWILCRQNPLNLPAYIYSSWQITAGYQEAMGTPVSLMMVWKGVAVLALLGIYLLLYLVLDRAKPDALASGAIIAAFVFLDWKHGFVRADAHMLVFFASALVVVTAFPALLDDPPRLRWLQRSLLLAAGVLAMWGIYDIPQEEDYTPAYVQEALSTLEETVLDNISHTVHWASFRASYRERLDKEKKKYDLPQTRATVGSGTIDVIGYEQAVAFYNGLNYKPRPVFQSMSAYNPYLAGLNSDFFASAGAPDYALVKIQTIDDRLPALDDPLLLRLLAYRYDYVLAENGYTLWKRRTQQPDEVVVTPQPLRTETLALNAPLALGDLAIKNLWVKIDLHPSLAGRIRTFFYKPPVVNITLEDTAGATNTFTIPLSQARTGFILNPLIEDNDGFVNFAAGKPGRQVRSFKLEVPEADRKFFAGTASVEISELAPPTVTSK